MVVLTDLSEKVLVCGDCGSRISASGFLSSYEGDFRSDIVDEILSGSCMVDCISCEDGVMSLGEKFSISEKSCLKPDFWGFE